MEIILDIMNAEEKLNYEILKYLAQPHIKGNENITGEIIRNNFSKIDYATYNKSRKSLIASKSIESDRITQTGEDYLKWLETEIKLESISDATLKVAKINRNISFLIGALTFLAICCQAFFAHKQNGLIEEQNSILQQSEQHKKESIEQLKAIPTLLECKKK